MQWVTTIINISLLYEINVLSYFNEISPSEALEDDVDLFDEESGALSSDSLKSNLWNLRV